MNSQRLKSRRLKQSYQVDNLCYTVEGDNEAIQTFLVVDSEVEAIQLESDIESPQQRRKSPEKPIEEDEDDPQKHIEKLFSDLALQYQIKLMVAKPPEPEKPPKEPSPEPELIEYNYYKELMRKEAQMEKLQKAKDQCNQMEEQQNIAQKKITIQDTTPTNNQNVTPITLTHQAIPIEIPKPQPKALKSIDNIKDFCEQVVQDFAKENRKRPRKKKIPLVPEELQNQATGGDQPRSILKNGPNGPTKKMTPEEMAANGLMRALEFKPYQEELLNYDVLVKNGRIIKVDPKTLPKYKEDFIFSHANEREPSRSKSRSKKPKKLLVEPSSVQIYNYKNPAPFINQNEDRQIKKLQQYQVLAIIGKKAGQQDHLEYMCEYDNKAKRSWTLQHLLIQDYGRMVQEFEFRVRHTQQLIVANKVKKIADSNTYCFLSHKITPSVVTREPQIINLKEKKHDLLEIQSSKMREEELRNLIKIQQDFANDYKNAVSDEPHKRRRKRKQYIEEESEGDQKPRRRKIDDDEEVNFFERQFKQKKEKEVQKEKLKENMKKLNQIEQDSDSYQVAEKVEKKQVKKERKQEPKIKEVQKKKRSPSPSPASMSLQVVIDRQQNYQNVDEDQISFSAEMEEIIEENRKQPTFQQSMQSMMQKNNRQKPNMIDVEVDVEQEFKKLASIKNPNQQFLQQQKLTRILTNMQAQKLGQPDRFTQQYQQRRQFI